MAAKTLGVKTWISIEPIIPRYTDLVAIIMDTMNWVDLYVLGALNYWKRLGFNFTKEEMANWYRANIPSVIELLRRNNKKFFIKKELKKYLDDIL